MGSLVVSSTATVILGSLSFSLGGYLELVSLKRRTGRNRPDGYRKSAWGRRYRRRIKALLEVCRVCGVRTEWLTFDHIVPFAYGGMGTMDNMTILCEPCQQRKGCQYWGGLKSLAQEEKESGVKPDPEETQRIESERLAIMATPATPDIPIPSQSKAVWQVQREMITDLSNRLNRAIERIDQLEKRNDKLTVRVQELEIAGATRSLTKRDEWGEKILEFLKEYPGVKFNSGTLAANLGTESKFISDKLKTMVGRGKIKGEKGEGLSAMFWIEKKEDSE